MFGLSHDELVSLISFWGYPVLFLAMIIEGPIATITGAFLSSLGYFNFFVVYWLSVTGDVIGDVILYYIGYFGGRSFLEKLEKIFKIRKLIIRKLENQFKNVGARIVFSVKITTGLAFITFILAGAVRMPFKKFIYNSFLGGLVWSAFLVVVGYFFGYAAEKVSSYLEYAGIFIFVAVLLLMTILVIYRKRQTAETLCE